MLLLGVILFALSTSAFLGLASERHHDETLALLRRDVLTGLYTETAFHEMKDELQSSGKRHGYAVVMVDIDHFKSINDRYGHAGGDAVLTHTGRLIANSMRLTDVAVRYGGEEFCIYLKGCSEHDAAQFAQRLVRHAAKDQVRLPNGQFVGFTMSAGFSAHSPTEDGASRPGDSLECYLARRQSSLSGETGWPKSSGWRRTLRTANIP